MLWEKVSFYFSFFLTFYPLVSFCMIQACSKIIKPLNRLKVQVFLHCYQFAY